MIKRRLVNAVATEILAVSISCMESAWSTNWRADPRCRVVFNALREDDWRFMPDRRELLTEFGWQDPCIVCITAGRFDADKNQATSVEVVAHLRKMGCDARLLLVGPHVNQPYTQEVLKMVTRLGLEDVIAIPGGRSDIRNLIGSANVMLCPSRREGMPGAVLEACAAGTPVVASDIPGVREVATHLNGVSTVGLDASVDEWAHIVLDTLERPRSHAVDEWPLKGSPFSVDDAAAALKSIYGR